MRQSGGDGGSGGVWADEIDQKLPAGVLAADLGLEVAGFAAGTAIVNAVFTQADFIQALAKRAVLVAGAGPLLLVAHHAFEFLGHGGRVTQFPCAGNTRSCSDL